MNDRRFRVQVEIRVVEIAAPKYGLLHGGDDLRVLGQTLAEQVFVCRPNCGIPVGFRQTVVIYGSEGEENRIAGGLEIRR